MTILIPCSVAPPEKAWISCACHKCRKALVEGDTRHRIYLPDGSAWIICDDCFAPYEQQAS